jgi:hypothetical protein
MLAPVVWRDLSHQLPNVYKPFLRLWLSQKDSNFVEKGPQRCQGGCCYRLDYEAQ